FRRVLFRSQYCGVIGDGCGGSKTCAACPAGQSCGGGGIAGVCGAPPPPGCMPLTCTMGSIQYCGGKLGDNCGGTMDCSAACPAGTTCGGGGVAGVCGAPPPANCMPLVCNDGTTQYCGNTGNGKVFAGTDPARFGAADPLYNAIVYVPNAQVQPFPTTGVSCDRCGAPASGSPLVSAISGPDGSFTLRNVPAGNNIPLVIQLGRWRRQVTIPTVTACTNNPVAASLTRLPRNHNEGD